MIDNSQLRKIILFFFFTFNNETTAIKAARKTLKQCNQKLKNSNPDQDDIESTMIYFLFKNWWGFVNKKDNSKLNLNHEASWILHENVNLGLWREFSKSASVEEHLTVLCSNVLNIKKENIARGLGISMGTVKHRVNRALQKMGRLRVSRA